MPTLNQNKQKQSSKFMEDNDQIQNMNSTTAIISSKICKLQDTGAIYASRIKIENEKLQKIDNDIKQNEKLLQEKRKLIINLKLKKSNQDPIILGKKLKTIQNDLEKQKIKYNETLAQNKLLREEINGLRQEKNIYKSIYQNLNAELKKKNQLKQIIQEKSEKTQIDIETTKNLLQIAYQKASQEKKQFNEEFESIYNSIEFDLKQDKYQNSKNGIRNNSNNNNNNSNLNKSNNNQLVNRFVNDDVYLTQINQKNQNQFELYQNSNEQKLLRTNIQKDQLNLENIRQEVQKYQETFEQLQKETGKETIEEIVKTFIDQEEINYSLFIFINGLSDELEKLEIEKKKLLEEIQQIEKPVEILQDLKQIQIKGMKKEIEESKQKQQQLQSIQDNLESQINKLIQGIPNLIKKLGCNNEKYLNQEGEQLNINEINRGNVFSFFNIIEQRTNDILGEHLHLNNNKGLIKGNNIKIQSQNINEINNDTQYSVSIEQYQNTNEVVAANQKEHNKDIQFKEIIEQLEEERVLAKTTNGFSQNIHKLYDKHDFKKSVENDLEQAHNKKLQKQMTKK